ncbi:protein farnesyltransferase subunit beta, putative [Plasmodium malariae]|uniref:Protein farnesyltransferase subunit beta, putative n=1 Tax=Plasmodium malariae TaxID=5858 RepID=A0A1C3KD94_PLAMA|nr:protein farnesyltransferase subunit beta, putative [Plasmodium malariae]
MNIINYLKKKNIKSMIYINDIFEPQRLSMMFLIYSTDEKQCDVFFSEEERITEQLTNSTPKKSEYNECGILNRYDIILIRHSLEIIYLYKNKNINTICDNYTCNSTDLISSTKPIKKKNNPNNGSSNKVEVDSTFQENGTIEKTKYHSMVTWRPYLNNSYLLKYNIVLDALSVCSGMDGYIDDKNFNFDVLINDEYSYLGCRGKEKRRGEKGCRGKKKRRSKKGLNQYTHIATTYATVCVFIYLHDEENNFLSFLDKKKLHTYILKLKCKDGSFRVHKNGEIDMRGTYCAISICSMCHILTNEVKKNVEKYIMSCQNYEGGFTSEKFQESHGGYTYCALATLCILGKIKKINLNNLMIWLINKQGNLEGAFMGRTNKLVDACYSFWIGSIFFLINEIYILKNFFQKYKKEKSLIHEKFKIVRKTGCTHLNKLKTFGVTDLQKKDSNSEKNEQTVLYSTKQNKTCNTTSYNTSTYNNNNGNSNSNNNENYCNKNESLTCLTEKKLIELEIMGKNKNFSFITSSILNEQFHFKNYKNKFMENKVLFNVNYLKLYLLLCSQGNNGGMKDKPNEKVDYYHTCYALSGLSLIENYILSNMQYSEDTYNNKDNINKLNKIHILYNITVSKVLKSYIYFSPNFPLSENKINHKVGKGAYLYLKRLIY